MAGGGSHWRIVDTRPGGNPIGRLAAALDAKGALRDEDPVDDELSFTEATLRRSSLGLTNVIEEARLPRNEKVLVLVDQFEELFRFIATAHTSEANDDASAFVKLLLEAARQSDVPIYVVITMRSDFLGDCARFRGLPEAINDGQYLIPRLTRSQRREAITGPASVFGATLSPTLVNRLLNDVGDVPDQLPILQHALMRTFDHCKKENPDSDTINLEDYEEIGGMAEALSRHADAILRRLSEDVAPEEGQGRQKIAEKLFKCLTEEGDGGRKVRRLAKLEDIADVANADVEEVASIIEAFRQPSNSFLMPPIGEELKPESYIDISHESLIRNWVTLSRWVEDEAKSANIYKRLAQTAVLHQKEEEDLLGGQALRVARDWRTQQQPNAAWATRYNPAYKTAMNFLTESDAHVRAAEDARVRSRRIRKTMLVGVALAILAPLLVMVHIKGVDEESIAKEAQYKAQMAAGWADHLLSRFYQIQSEDGSQLPPPATGTKFGDFINDYGKYYAYDPYWINDPYWIMQVLRDYEQYAHADIVQQYHVGTEDAYDTSGVDIWGTSLAEELLDAIWYAELEPGELFDAILRTGVRPDRLIDAIFEYSFSDFSDPAVQARLKSLIREGSRDKLPAGQLNEEIATPARDKLSAALLEEGLSIEDLLYALLNAELATPKSLFLSLRKSGLADGPDFDELSEEFAALSEQKDGDPDSLLAAIYTSLRSDEFDLEQVLEKKRKLDNVVNNTAHSVLAANAIFNHIKRERLRQIIAASADHVNTLESELNEIKQFIVDRNIFNVEKYDKGSGVGANELEESDSDKFTRQRRELSADELMAKFNGSKDPEEQSRVALVWVTFKLKELVGKIKESDLRDIRDSPIAKFLDEPDMSRSVIQNIRNAEWYDQTKEIVIALLPLIVFVVAWLCWMGWRRYRARRGTTIAVKASLIRLGLASLLDILIALVLGVALGFSAAAFTSLPAAIAFGSFEKAGDFLIFTFITVGAITLIGYLLVRDAIKFRFQRSFGKVLFELRPVTKNGGPITKKTSAKRNWILLIGLPLIGVIFVFSMIFLVETIKIGEYIDLYLDVDLDNSVVAQIYLVFSVLLVESLVILILVEKLGDRIAKTRVIDTRSEEAAAIDSSGNAALKL